MATLGPTDIDLGGNSVHLNNIYYGAAAPGQYGTLLDTSVITSLQQPATMILTAKGCNFNATNGTDIASWTLTLPTGYTRYAVTGVYISNASATLASTPAVVGLYTAASAGGVAICSAVNATVSSASDHTNNNMQSVTITDSTTRSFAVASEGTLYFNLATQNGSATTADVTVALQLLP